MTKETYDEVEELKVLLTMVITDICTGSGRLTKKTAIELHKYNAKHRLFT